MANSTLIELLQEEEQLVADIEERLRIAASARMRAHNLESRLRRIRQRILRKMNEERARIEDEQSNQVAKKMAARSEAADG